MDRSPKVAGYRNPKKPVCNVWLTLFEGVGAKAESFGDATGIIEHLVA